MEQIWKTTGIKPDALTPPSFPMLVEHLWRWFKELNKSRTSNGVGMNPITYSEIVSWSNLTQTEIHPWEVDIMKSLDQEYLRVMSTKENPE